MKKVLIVLKDETLFSKHCTGHESLFFANDGVQALGIMQKEAIDLLIMGWNASGTDCVELIAVAALQYPSVKVVILLAIDRLTMADCKRLKTFKSIYFALEPDSEKEVENFLDLLNVIEHQALSVESISTADFLKLIQSQKKSCLLSIEQKNSSQKALVYFENGVLYDVVSGLLQSEAAVSEILTWKHPQLVFRPPIQKQIRRKIFFDLDEFISEQEKNNGSNIEENSLDLLIEQVLAKAEERIKMEEAKAKAETETQQNHALTEKTATAFEEPAKKAGSISISELENILKPLSDINDYFASAVFDSSGNLMAQHATQSYHFDVLAKTITTLIKTVTNSTSSMGLGDANFIHLNCDNNIVLAVWEPNHQLIAVLLLNADSKLAGLAKMNLITAYWSMLKNWHE